jgi:hypothetical protein
MSKRGRTEEKKTDNASKEKLSRAKTTTTTTTTIKTMKKGAKDSPVTACNCSSKPKRKRTEKQV